MTARRDFPYQGLIMSALLFVSGCGAVGMSGDRKHSEGFIPESGLLNLLTSHGISTDAVPGMILAQSASDISGCMGSEEKWISTSVRIDLDHERTQWKDSIDSSAEVDLFDLGPLFMGEWITIEVKTLSGTLNPVAALFDADMNLLYANDDQAYYCGMTGSWINMPIPVDLNTCYLGVASSHLSGTTGTYEIAIEQTAQEWNRTSQEQLVYLDFNGIDNLQIGTYEPTCIPAFEETLLGVTYADDIDALLNKTTEHIRIAFHDIPVVILSSQESGCPDQEHTTIYFGGYHECALGHADSVDEWNILQSQNAVVYTQAFEIFMNLDPTYEEMAYAMANVATHEMGHLLGLQHTQGGQGVMAIDRTIDQYFEPCCFERAPLAPEVFPIGYQDALWTLGLALNTTQQNQED